MEMHEHIQYMTIAIDPSCSLPWMVVLVSFGEDLRKIQAPKEACLLVEIYVSSMIKPKQCVFFFLPASFFHTVTLSCLM